MSFGGGQGTLGLLPVFDQGQDGSCLRSEPCWGIAVLPRSLSIGTCAPVLITGRLLTGMWFCLATVTAAIPTACPNFDLRRLFCNKCHCQLCGNSVLSVCECT